MPKITLFDRLNSPKFDFTQNLSGRQIVKFPQCAALTSHFESFWSIVLLEWQINSWPPHSVSNTFFHCTKNCTCAARITKHKNTSLYLRIHVVKLYDQLMIQQIQVLQFIIEQFCRWEFLPVTQLYKSKVTGFSGLPDGSDVKYARKCTLMRHLAS